MNNFSPLSLKVGGDFTFFLKGVVGYLFYSII
jgi:hypothetical protein